jgi:hypothetical protein
MAALLISEPRRVVNRVAEGVNDSGGFLVAFVQAGLGGITGGVGNSVAFGTSLAVVRSGTRATSAIQGGAFAGGVAGTALSFGANAITPTELGGMTNEGGFCPRKC